MFIDFTIFHGIKIVSIEITKLSLPQYLLHILTGKRFHIFFLWGPKFRNWLTSSICIRGNPFDRLNISVYFAPQKSFDYSSLYPNYQKQYLCTAACNKLVQQIAPPEESWNSNVNALLLLVKCIMRVPCPCRGHISTFLNFSLIN